MPSINSPLATTDSHSLSRDCAEFSTSQAPHRKNNPSVRELIEYIEELERRVDILSRTRIFGYWGLTPSEAKIIRFLYTEDEPQRYSDIFAAVYGDRRNPPDIKTVGVYLSQIRSKIGRERLTGSRGVGITLTPAGRQWAEENEVRW